MRLGGVDHVVAVIEPVADQRLDQRRRMLAVAVDEQHGAEPGVIEAGEQRRLLAEIARQRHDLHIERRGRQRAGDRKRIVAAAVVDIDHLAGEPALGAERARHLGELAHAAARSEAASLWSGTTMERPGVAADGPLRHWRAVPSRAGPTRTRLRLPRQPPAAPFTLRSI